MRSPIRVACLFLAALGTGCPEPEFPTADEIGQMRGLLKQRTPPWDSTNQYADRPEARALGKKLFQQSKFSSCGFTACASCHPAPSYASSRTPACGGVMDRDAPTLLNSGWRTWFYWDGRKDTLWSHPLFPLLNKTELDSTPERVKQVMQELYAADYLAAFGMEVEREADNLRLLANFGKAIAAHLRTLVRVNAPFDDQLRSFIDAAEAGGASGHPMFLQMKVYVRKGRCVVCHEGPMLTDNNFHNLGLAEKGREDHGRLTGRAFYSTGGPDGGPDPWRSDGIYSDDREVGRVKLAGLMGLPDEKLDGTFKTPTLRNVDLTAPYMHNASFETLEKVIDFYDQGGDPEGFAGKRSETIIPLHLSPEEKRALVDLLKSLTGAETP